MPNLVSGIQMFYGTSLEHFCGVLSNLEHAEQMFAKNCKLSEDSIINIVDGIKDISSLDSAPHKIDIGYDTKSLSESSKNSLASEFLSKGWIVKWWPNGALKQF
jgi:hypothetical protein